MKCNMDMTRREAIRKSAIGVGAAGLSAGLLNRSLADAPAHPLAAKPPHFAPRAKRVILLFQTGGVSHVDSFDPKEKLNDSSGKSQRGKKLLGSPWPTQARGQSGIRTTDLFPQISAQIDDLCLIRSMHGDHGDHFEATLHMHCGSNGSALPGIGAWISYGLGTANPNLPSHVVFAARQPYAGAQAWDSNFLPAYHQGVRVMPGTNPIPHLRPYAPLAAMQARELKMLRRLNEQHFAARPDHSELTARMLSFKTAASMQRLAPDLFDLSGESERTLELYGLRRGDKQSFGWQCLMARRMAEREVRFIELIDTGSSGNWDAHSDIKSHARLAKIIDRPIAGLIQDLKQRGMLDDTLVVWCTEFGRTPFATGTGRGHHRYAFSCWLAGGGVKAGYVHGESDELGSRVIRDGVHVHDFHATILHLLGLDHKKLTFSWAGRDFRLTDVSGNVVRQIIA